MGFFGSFSFDGQWTEGVGKSKGLVIEIHDSDVATVVFPKRLSGSDRFYLGVHPRDYFEDPAAGVPVDTDRVAAAFCKWVRMSPRVDLFHNPQANSVPVTPITRRSHTCGRVSS